jgi:hypothetical protein
MMLIINYLGSTIKQILFFMIFLNSCGINASKFEWISIDNYKCICYVFLCDKWKCTSLFKIVHCRLVTNDIFNNVFI